MEKLKVEDQFVKRIVLCLDNRKFTEVELEKEYDKKYPLPREPISVHKISRIFRHRYSVNHVSVKVADVLRFLCNEGYCTYEISYFTDQVVEEGAKLYFLTRKGRDLIKKKK